MPEYRLPPAPPDDYAPVLDWELFYTRVFEWLQDQHVAIIGPTDQGKTNLAYWLLQLRDYVAYMGIKVRDKTLSAFAEQGGYQRLYTYPPLKRTPGRMGHMEVEWGDMPRRLVWPDASDRRRAKLAQVRAFGTMLDDCWSSGSVCTVWDDFWYLVRILGLELDAKQNLLNARSNDSAQLMIAQRGAGNRMVELFDQPVHLFFARETDTRNLSLLGPTNSPRRGFVANLAKYQFLYENTRTGERYRVTAPKLQLAA